MRAVQELAGKFAFLVWAARRVLAAPAFSQAAQVPEETCAFEHSPD
jgi:hypothetical protein